MDQIQIDECIKAVRMRMRYGHNKYQIAEQLGRYFTQDMLFLAYNAAMILENMIGMKNVKEMIIATIGITPLTQNIHSILTIIGVPIDTQMYIYLNPLVREFKHKSLNSGTVKDMYTSLSKKFQVLKDQGIVSGKFEDFLNPNDKGRVLFVLPESAPDSNPFAALPTPPITDAP